MGMASGEIQTSAAVIESESLGAPGARPGERS